MGIRKARKFKIDTDGCPAYEALINSPFVKVISEQTFSNYGDFYIIVHYLDLGYTPEEGSDDGGD